MTVHGNGAGKPARDEVRGWLVERVALYLDEPAETIDVDADLGRYGLDSAYTFALCGEIDEVWGVTVEPSQIWDVENLAELAEHILEAAAQPSTR